MTDLVAANIATASVVLDEAIYPRVAVTTTTVNRYAEALNAGDEFPPITLENGTDRLLDGMHRLRAHEQAGRSSISATWVDIPDGVPARLFAASLSARHGDRLSGDELKTIAREIAEQRPDFDIQTIARYAGVTRQTVSKWVADIIERRREVRRVAAAVLALAGWSTRQIGEHLDLGKSQVSDDVKADISGHLDEGLLRAAAALLPDSVDIEGLLEQVRQERIFAGWSVEELDLLKRLRAGETVVVSMRTHNDLIAWATAADLYVRIDRRGEWGNPFEMPDDGDRDTVIANFAEHYLPHKPSLLSKLDGLRGKALGCWCAPESCHGDILKTAAEGGEPR